MSKLQHNLNKSSLTELQILVQSFFSQFKVLAGLPFYSLLPSRDFTKLPVTKDDDLKSSSNPQQVNENNKATRKIKLIKLKGIFYVPYFVANKETSLLLTEHKLKTLSLTIIQTLKLKECEVRFIRLEYPYLDNSVLTQYLAYNGTKYNFTQLQKGVLNKANILSINLISKETQNLPLTFITGIKVEVAGRLTTQRSIPRKTVDNTHTGSFTVNKKLGFSLNSYQLASKNKLGVFSVKIGSSYKTVS